MSIDKIIKSAHFESFLNGWTTKERINICTADNFETAYWRFQPPHKIVIGRDIEKKIKAENLKNAKRYYIESYFYHELAHAKYTERNIEIIKNSLKKDTIPFALYNLFEDARIEEKWRQEIGRPFKWAEYEIPELNWDEMSDEEIFFHIIQFEGIDKIKPLLKKNPLPSHTTLTLIGFNTSTYKFIIRSSAHNLQDEFFNAHDLSAKFNLKGSWILKASSSSYSLFNYSIKHPYYSVDMDKNIRNKGTVKLCHTKVEICESAGKAYLLNTYEDKPSRSCDIELENLETRFKTVSEFYTRTINAKNSMEVVDICADWIKSHPRHKHPQENILCLLGNTLTRDASEFNICNAEKGNNGIKFNTVVSDNNETQEEKEGKPIPYTKEHHPDYSSNDPSIFFEDKNQTLDIKDVNRLTRIFERILKKKTERIATSLPQKRLNIRGYVLKKNSIFSKKSVGGTNSGKKDISIIVDCSGSMTGSPLNNGKIFLMTLNQLAKSERISGNIILSTEGFNKHSYATYTLPIKDDNFFINLKACDDEGFSSTFEKTYPLLKKSDLVFVYTDGCIGDKPDRDYAHKRGIYTYGLYAGNEDMTNELLTFFDCAISRKSTEELINALITKIK